MTTVATEHLDPLAQKKKAWSGRFSEPVADFVLRYTASVDFDKRMALADIAGSIAHATMMNKCGVLHDQDLADIKRGMKQIIEEIKSGKFEWKLELEDVHLNVEARLTQLVGDAGKRLHTGRSRNDQVATDMRLYMREEIDTITDLVCELQEVLVHLAANETDTIMPGFTHMQVAQPVTLGHHLLAYVEMFERDRTRLIDLRRRVNQSPLGAAALAGTTYPIDREVYTEGWAENGAIVDEHEVEGYRLRLRYQGVEAGPLFWAHYSFLGLDPRGLRDDYCEDYFGEMRDYSLINRAYCIRNPRHYKGYGKDCWGLTASYSTAGYAAHAPVEREDRGVIAPTAALSSIVYTPEESMDVMRYLYGPLHEKVWGPYGFYDAFSQTDDWYPQKYLAIDQGPIAVMIENHRSELLWRLFMSHPDVQNGLRKLGFDSPVLQ